MPATTMRVPMAGRAQRMPEYNGPGQIVEAQASARFDDSAAGIALKGSAERAAQAANGGPWRDIQRVAEAASKFAVSAGNLYDDYSKYKAQDAYNQYQEEMMVKRADLERLEGANAIGANGGQSVKQQLEDYGREARERLGKDLNGHSMRYFDAFATSEDRKNYAWAVGKERKEWDAYQKTVDLGTITTAYNQAMNDPSQFGQSVGTIKATYEQMGRREGWSPEYVQAKVQEEEQKIAMGVYQGLIDADDLVGGKQFRDNFSGILTPTMQKKMDNMYGRAVYERLRLAAEIGDVKTFDNTVQSLNASLGIKSPNAQQGYGASLYNRTQEMIQRGVRYGMGARGLNNSQIDCSGFVGASQAEAMEAANKQAGKEVFPKSLIDSVRNTTSEEIITKVSKATGVMLRNEQVNANTLQEGMIIGLDTGPKKHDKGRPLGIDHIVQVVVNPETGRKMIAESTSGKGVITTPIEQWLAKNSQHKLFATGVNVGAGKQELAQAENQPPTPVGMVEQGNIKDTQSLPATMVVSSGGKQVLIPQVDAQGNALGQDDALAQFEKTGKHYGKFNSADEANAYAQTLKEQPQAQNVSGEGAAPQATATLNQERNINIANVPPKYQAMILALRKHAVNMRKNEAKLSMTGLENQLAYAMGNGDFSYALATQQRLVDNGHAEEAAEVGKIIELREQAYTYMQDNAELPIAEQLTKAEKDFAARRNVQNMDIVKDIDHTKAAVIKDLNEKAKSFANDPAAYVAKNAALQDKEGAEKMSFQERTRRSLELQQEVGKGMVFDPKIFSKQEKLAYRSEYDKQPTAEAKVMWLSGKEKEWGPYFQSALAEMEMPKTVVGIAPILNDLTQSDAALFLKAATADAKTETNASGVKEEDAKSNVESSKLGKALLETRSANIVNDGVTKIVDDMIKTLTVANIMGMDVDAISNKYDISTSNQSFLFIPKKYNVNADIISEYLQTQRDTVKEKLLANPPKFTGITFANGTTMTPEQEETYWRKGINECFSQAVWMMTGEKEVLLINPKTEQPYAYGDGKLVAFDVEALGREAAMAGDFEPDETADW